LKPDLHPVHPEKKQLNHRDTENTEKNVRAFFPWFTRWLSGDKRGKSVCKSVFFGFLCVFLPLW